MDQSLLKRGRGRPRKDKTKEQLNEESKKRIMVRRLKNAPIEDVIERIKMELEILLNRLNNKD